MKISENNLSIEISLDELKQFVKEKTGKDLTDYELSDVDNLDDDGIRLEYDLV